VVIACGIWSPRIAAMAGASIPLTPAVHQMIDIGPVPLFTETTGEIAFPIVRDVDTNMYERQNGGDFEIGSYAHRAILMEPDEIPSIEESSLSPTQLPFTAEDFDLQMEQALELFPDIVGDERIGIRHSINGLLSLTPDGMPILGETAEVKGLWSAAAIWIKEAPGIAKTVAEWMTNHEPEIDPHGADISRFYEYAKTRTHIHARTAAEVFADRPAADGRRLAKVMNYGIVYGMGTARAARELGVAPAEAAAYIDRYLGRYPGVRAFMEATIGEARTRGWVTTVLGRRRYLPELGSRDAAVRQFAERAATNTPIQGSAADLIKLAMLEVRRRLAREPGTRMLLQVHDELLLEVPVARLDAVKETVRDAMERVFPLRVPLKVDVRDGANWTEAH